MQENRGANRMNVVRNIGFEFDLKPLNNRDSAEARFESIAIFPASLPKYCGFQQAVTRCRGFSQRFEIQARKISEPLPVSRDLQPSKEISRDPWPQ